jgi:hypothetical protein
MGKYLNWKPFAKVMTCAAIMYAIVATAASIGYAQCKTDMSGKGTTTPKVNN